MDLHREEFKKVQEASHWIKSSMPFIPKASIILGTGMSSWLDELNIIEEFKIKDVPHMVPPTVETHQGRICFTMINEVPTIILAGRLHYYEGHPMSVVVRPVRILYTLGARHLLLTNASGGLNPEFESGDIVAIRDHINLVTEHPLRGPNDDRWGPRFPDMKYAYDPDWLAYAKEKGESLGINIKSGVYAGLPGPSLETPAEYQYLYRIGADLVGMSTVPEVITARHLGMKVLALSIVTNVCYPPERIKVTTVEDVIGMVEKKAIAVGNLIQEVVSYIK
ncbi:MAG: purine-nucleoside phosphorylase [Saprospiraceae bacterium]|uniref:Purine nucleoside phosphorylase n=1 Tax=Candidatus Opimibacter skivensis TaxID=2982028 RepID=A0A9D7XPW4_9BACT|nr:purine-nucleoside phosphorylase [Candidatus Opimibacter skivensis]